VVAIADTEMTLAESKANYRDPEEYATAILATLQEVGERTDVETVSFSQLFGSDYDILQKYYEQLLTANRSLYPDLDTVFKKISKARLEKYKQILGRSEKDEELTIRYAAQYMALPEIVMKKGIASLDNLILINYPTPNIKFYNFDSNYMPRKIPVAVVKSSLEKRG